MGKVVIIGAGPIGLAAGMMLSDAALKIVVLDKDATTPPDSAEDAWDGWSRPGVSQFRQVHGLLPLGREIVETRLPAVYDELQNLGAYPINMADHPPPTIPDWSPEPEDIRFSSLAARRPIYELAFAKGAEHSGLDVRRGVEVVGLTTSQEKVTGVPHVNGVVTGAGDRLEADLLIDAGGRRSPLPALLEAAGARAMHERAQDSRFAYYTRFYRKRDTFPQPYTMSLFRAGSISLLTVPGDNDTWGVTIFATTADRAMRAVRDPKVFEKVIRAHPLHAGWVEGEPITEVEVMAGVSDRERSIFVDGSPVATGVLPVADAWACTNPSLGRGITMGLMQTVDTLPGIRTHLDDPLQMAHEWQGATEARVAGIHEATLRKDRARNEEMDAVRTGRRRPPRVPSLLFDENDPKEMALFGAMMHSAAAFRAGIALNARFASYEEATQPPEVSRALADEAASPIELPPLDIPTRSNLEALLT